MQPDTPLSQDDIARLMNNRSAETQIAVVQKLGAHYNDETKDGFTDEQSQIANDIFRLLLTHAEVQVRTVLSQNLSHTSKLPPAIARQIASDVSEVAAPILENSLALSDEDLLAIIKSDEDAEKLQAIARRERVSETVSDALVETKLEPVVSTLVQNEKAEISEKTFDKIVERHNGSSEIVERLFQRSAIPIATVDKVINQLSDTMRKELEHKYGNLAEFKEMKKALDRSLEVTSLRMIGYKSSDQELMQLLNYLDSNNKLSPFSALSSGNLQLFAVSLSRLLHVPLKNVERLLAQPEGLKAAYLQAELPESLFEAVELAVRSILEIEAESVQKTGMKQMCTPFQVMDRMMQNAGDRHIDGSDYLYAMINQCCRNNIAAKTH